MKRLLKISFDLALLSFTPVLSWFLLSIIVDKNLINTFTLTYPIQFIYYILKSIFSTGANISKEKDNNKNSVMSGLVTGILIAILIFGFILINIDSYINFMNMSISIYKTFAIYSIILLFIQVVFAFLLEKLYYEEKNTLANTYSITFNFLNIISLICTALITKNQLIIITVPLVLVSIFTIIILIKSFDKFKYQFDIISCIKYDSVDLCNNIFFLIIFLFGLSNVLSYGEEYAIAITFASLLTDTQWDAFDSISIAAQIDISKNKFNYKKHKQNAYKLLILLFSTTFIMFLSLCWFYKLNYSLTFIYLSFDVINFIIYPIYRLKTCYLQIEWSPIKVTTNKLFSSCQRVFISFINSPFCTGIGQLTTAIYQLVSLSIIFKKHYSVTKNGEIIKKK